jgi:hypothetical protein
MTMMMMVGACRMMISGEAVLTGEAAAAAAPPLGGW